MGRKALVLLAAATLAVAVTSRQAWSRSGSSGAEEYDSPPTSIEPAPLPPEAGKAAAPQPPANASPEASAPAAGNAKPGPQYRSLANFEVEPAEARVKVIKAAPIYATPTTADRRLERVTAGAEVQVTGVTRHWLRLKLHNGKTGYIEQSNAELVKPVDKLFVLTSNAPVLSAPNRWARKLNEVHKGHNVHIIGIAPNYFEIQMRSGLKGYIVQSALE
jgi:hypothetical protein